jgi:hypothetical protein
MPYRAADSSITGVVVLVLNPEKLAQEFEARQWPVQHRLTVFDRDGAVVLRIPRKKGNEQSARDREIFSHARDAAAGTVRLKRRTGHDEIVGFIPLKDAPDGLVVRWVPTATSRSHA